MSIKQQWEELANIPPSIALTDSESDKVNYHNMGFWYDMLIQGLVTRTGGTIEMCEIGCSYHENGSASVFSSLPYIQQYVGIDKNPLKVAIPDPHIFLQGDAYSKEVLEKLSLYAPFDLIIDDGSHDPKHQVFFFVEYRQFLKPNGILFCEDVQANYLEKILYPCEVAGVDVNKMHLTRGVAEQCGYNLFDAQRLIYYA